MLMLPNDEYADWLCVPDLIDISLEKCAAPGFDLRRQAANVLTIGDVSYYYSPLQEKAALYGQLSPTRQDLALCKAAAVRALGCDHVRDTDLTLSEIEEGTWVKLAFSPVLRRTGELLNFFPGKYPGGYPNAPSPLAATLTGGLAGAGLGYATGALAENLLPEGWDRRRLRKTMAMLGGAVGAAPGAMWSVSAAQRGKSLLDGSDTTNTNTGLDAADLPLSSYKAAAEVLEDVQLGERYKHAVDIAAKSAFDTFGMPAPDEEPSSALDVNINQMGHTLWETGASPQVAATTMGALYAAQQMPDPNAQPGYATPHQMGMLGTMLGAAGGGAQGYATGWLVGKGLGILTGMPAGTQSTLSNAGAMLGVINTLIPRLFQ